MTNELKEWFNSKVEEIVATAKSGASVSKDVAEQVAITVNLGDNDEITNKISEFEAKAIELTNKISLLEEDLISAKGNNETLTVEVEGLNATINKAGATATVITTDGDPTIIENKVVDANIGFYNMIAGRVQAKFNN